MNGESIVTHTNDFASARPLPSRQEMARAYSTSDPSYDGIFYTAVTSTGIFCRPSCPARKPRLANVEFFGSVREALFAGYRPCLRCRPLEVEAARPEWIRRLLASVDESPGRRRPNAELRSLGVDPARARRYFVKTFGLTFQAYCRGRRLARALQIIRSGGSLDAAVFESGYDSHSGFRDSFARTFGHPPGRMRDADCIHLAWLDTPLGPMVAGATTEGLCRSSSPIAACSKRSSRSFGDGCAGRFCRGRRGITSV
jgi:AraC family transcriptional regulator of adaptative response/methylated-DNA-[protein]-cysteine methyltransferase